MTPHHGKFISYLRVSTRRQGESGLGLEAQRAAVGAWLNGGNWKLVAEYVETESGKNDRNRPELRKSLEACKVYGATLVIAKLDRLSRNAHFLTGLHEAGVKFVAVDMPEANEMVVTIMAAVAQAERRMISDRTKAALQAAKARGKKLGNPRPETAFFHDRVAAAAAAQKAGVAVREAADAFARLVRPALEELAGASANRAAQQLNRLGVRTARGGNWTARTVLDVRKRLEAQR